MYEALVALYKAKQSTDDAERIEYLKEYIRLKGEAEMKMRKAKAPSEKMSKIIIYGGAMSGKTTLAAKIAKDNENIAFLSTDGNAYRQGYIAGDVEYKGVLETSQDIADTIKSLVGKVEYIAFDLIEGIEDAMRANFIKTNLKENKGAQISPNQWGQIGAFYVLLAEVLMNYQDNFTYIFISRENERFTKDGKTSLGMEPALRDLPAKEIMPDVDLKIHASNWGGDIEYEIIAKRNVPEQLIKLIEGE